jgi:RNA polymerase sigma-70 factor (ECF subfamily)
MSRQRNTSDIIEKIKQGDEQVFEELFFEYYPRLHAFAMEFLRDHHLAKDAVQEIFIKLWEKRNSVWNGSLSGFLYTMVRNQCLNYLRHKKVMENRKMNLKQAVYLEEVYRIDFMRDQPCTLIEKQLNEELEEAMGELPPKCRKVFTMSRKEGMKNREIADRLGFSLKNVEKHLSRALKHFRHRFNRQLYMNHIILGSISLLSIAKMCL